MDINEKALEMHKQWKGKLEVKSKATVKTAEDLSIAYTPGVAEPCRKIHSNKEDVYEYTMKGNTVAVISDGTAVLGLGDIGPEAAIPVMEGKCVLFKEFGGVNAVPICLDTKDTDEIVKTIKYLAPNYGGINLEDISAPRCFEIEERLKKELDIPVFHDDQHGTAVVVLAGIINAMKLVKKDKATVKVVINGAGSAGTAICKLLLNYGFKNIIVCDRSGIIHKDLEFTNWAKKELSEITNPHNEKGTLADALKNADIFIGVSSANVVSLEMAKTMNKDAIVFAMANPVPEILPDIAKQAGIRIMGTGRSDYPNQVNNVLVFPGIFKGAMQARAKAITEEMKLAAAEALANMIPETELNEENILPKPFDEGVADKVAEAVKKVVK